MCRGWRVQSISLFLLLIVSYLGIFILAMAYDVFNIDVPQPLDGIRYHEASHQVCVTVEYSAGLQMLLLLGSHALSISMFCTITITS